MSTVVERDTVSPSAPNLVVTKTNAVYNGITDPFEEYLKIQINGSEAFSKAYITITDYEGANKPREVNLDANGNVVLNNAWGLKLDCGYLNYTITARLQDRAGNYSQMTTTAITTGECSSCSYQGNGTFINPIQDTTSYGKVNSDFGSSRGDDIHAGVDFSVAYNGNVVAAANGTVDLKGFEAGGWGNYIIIKHLLPNTEGTTDTYFTIYAHLLSTTNKSVGDSVAQGEVIGKGGNIGKVSPSPTATNPTAGTHLHFQIQKLGAPLIQGMSRATASGNRGNVINPSFLLSQIQGNIPNQVLIDKYCKEKGLGDSAKQEPDYPKVNKQQALNSFLNYIRTNLSPTTVLETLNDNRATYLKVSDVSSDNSTAYNQLKDYISYPTGTTNPANTNNQNYSNSGESGTWVLRIGNGQWDSLKVLSTNQTGYKGVLAINTRQQIQNDQNNPNNNIYKVYTVKNEIYERYSLEFYGSSPIGVPTSEEQPGKTKANISTTNATEADYQGFERGYNSKRYSNNRIFRGNHPQEAGGAKYVVGEVAEYYNTTGDVNKYGYPTGFTFSERGSSYCKQYFEKDVVDVCLDLNNYTYVTGGDAFRGVNDSTEKTERKYNFQVISSNSEQDKHRYNGYSNVWILSHGWQNNPSNWACKDDKSDFANTILKVDPNAIILCLNWSDAAQNGYTQGIVSPDQQASWIGVTANSVVAQLKLWGLDQNTASTKLNLIGHSLGTLMSATISQAYNKANYMILMDPPGGSTEGKGFDVKAGYGKLSSFSGKANFSRAFSVVGTVADDPNHGSTADESFLVYMDGIWTPHELHQGFLDKVKEFLSNKNNFCNIYTSCDYFKANNDGNNGFPKANIVDNITLQQNHSGVILTTGANNRNLEYLAIKENNSDNMILLGNNQNNSNMSPNKTDLRKDRDYIMYGKDGDDVFLNPDARNYTKNIFIKDFKDGGDRVSLWREQYKSNDSTYSAKNYSYNLNNGEHQIKVEKCDKFIIGGILYNCATEVSVKVEGDRIQAFLVERDALNPERGFVVFR